MKKRDASSCKTVQDEAPPRVPVLVHWFNGKRRVLFVSHVVFVDVFYIGK
jgi:hypothetical protein